MSKIGMYAMFIKTHTVLNDLHHAARVCIFVVTDVWVAGSISKVDTHLEGVCIF